jgi:hypothetical protein
MARKKARRRSGRTPRAAASAVGSKLLPVASTVWVEIGEVWLERNPKDWSEVMVKERQTRRFRRG